MVGGLLVVALTLGCGGAGAPGVAAVSSVAPVTPVPSAVRTPASQGGLGAGSQAAKGAARASEIQPSWRFSLGSPVAAAPAVTADGHVHVASADGTVTALGPDGRFRWSYGVGASVQGAPAVAGDVTYVGTAEGRVVALKSSGQKLWSYRVPTAVVSDLVVGKDGVLRFAGADGTVYAVTARGGAAWRRALGEDVSAGPSLGPDGSVLVGTASGSIVWIDSAGRKRGVRVGAAILQQEWGGGRRVYAVSGSDLLALNDDGVIRWRVPRVRTLVVTGEHVLAAESSGRLSWWTAAGRLEQSVDLAQRPSDAPVVAPDGTAYVPTEMGEVLVVREGRVVGGVAVAPAAVLRPRLDARHRQLVAVAGDGSVVGVSTDHE